MAARAQNESSEAAVAAAEAAATVALEAAGAAVGSQLRLGLRVRLRDGGAATAGAAGGRWRRGTATQQQKDGRRR